MKKIFLKMVLICFFGMLMAGCDNLVTTGKSETVDPAGRGIVRIYIGEANTDNARTLQPASDKLAGYRLTFSGTVAHDPVNISSGNYADVYLADGTYEITAKAYKKDGIIGNAGDETASGSISGIVMDEGVVTSNDGVIPPIILAPSGSGNGVLHYQITKEDYDSAESSMTLYQINGTTKITGFASGGTLTFTGDNSAGATGDYPIAAGRYIVEIKLVNEDGDVAYYRDVVEIWPGITTDLVFDPENYTNPSLGLAYSGATLSVTATKINDIAIGNGSGTGASETNPRAYVITVPDTEEVSIDLARDNNSLYADISFVTNNGSIPDGLGYHKTLPDDFSVSNVLWLKVVSEDTAATTYYKFTFCPTLPEDFSFEDTDMQHNRVGGTISWAKPSVLNGIHGYHIYYGSNTTAKIGDAIYTIDDSETESQLISTGTTVPANARYLLIANYDVFGNDYPLLVAIPFFDNFDDIFGDFAAKGDNGLVVSYSSNIFRIAGNGNYEITMNGVSSTTSHRIVVASGIVDLTINGVNINTTGCAFEISGGTVNLTVKSNNYFTSGSHVAGIRVVSGSNLNITAASNGLLEARGGAGAAGARGGDNGNTTTLAGAGGGAAGRGGAAGIGGNAGEHSGSITISGGTIRAYGGNGGNGGGGGDSTGGGGGGGAGAGGGGAGIGGGGGNGGDGGNGGRGANPQFTFDDRVGQPGGNGSNGNNGTITTTVTVTATGGNGGSRGSLGSGGSGGSAGGTGGRGGNIGGGGAGGGGGGGSGSSGSRGNGTGGNGGSRNGVAGAANSGANGGNGAQ